MIELQKSLAYVKGYDMKELIRHTKAADWR